MMKAVLVAAAAAVVANGQSDTCAQTSCSQCHNMVIDCVWCDAQATEHQGDSLTETFALGTMGVCQSAGTDCSFVSVAQLGNLFHYEFSNEGITYKYSFEAVSIAEDDATCTDSNERLSTLSYCGTCLGDDLSIVDNHVWCDAGLYKTSEGPTKVYSEGGWCAKGNCNTIVNEFINLAAGVTVTTYSGGAAACPDVDAAAGRGGRVVVALAVVAAAAVAL